MHSIKMIVPMALCMCNLQRTQKPSVKSKHTMRKLKIIEQWKGSGTHQIPTTRRMMVSAYGGPTCRQDTARLPRLRPSADNPLSGRWYSAERSLSLCLSKQCSRTLGHPGRGHRLCSRPITVASHQLSWMPQASLHPRIPHPDWHLIHTLALSSVLGQRHNFYLIYY